MGRLPRYPVYVISKGRADICLTANFLRRDGIPFQLVVEPQETAAYTARYGSKTVTTLPFANLGKGSYPARNWCWEDALERGHRRHWILDDNIGQIRRLYRGFRIPCASGPAFAAVEDFVDRYTNVPIGGMNYQMFVTPTSPAYRTNVHVYSCLLIENSAPYRWRLRYNEDTDLCLQALAAGQATILVNAFMVDKKTTMTMKGGNSDELYQGDGRLRMARALERTWPGIVSVGWRYGRPQHVVDWTQFRTPLVRRSDLDISTLPERDEYGLELRAVSEVRSGRLTQLVDQFYDRPFITSVSLGKIGSYE
jgi:hypothetical protein